MKISDIVVGERSRRDLTKIDQLAASIERVGLIQPPVVREVGGAFHLVAGRRRLAAMEHLGWVTTKVTVAHDITDELAALLAEGEENTEREPFTVAEAVEHRRRIHTLEARLAKERQQASGQTYGRGIAPSKLEEPIERPKPHEGTTRHRTAKATGFGATTLDKAEQIIAVAEAPETPEPVREVAQEAVTALKQHGVKVDAERRKVEEALARHVDGDQSVLDARYMHAFLKHLNRFEMGTWDAERIGSLATEDDMQVIDMAMQQVAAWHNQLKNQRSGLRLVKGGAQ